MAATPVTEDQVIEALRPVEDPELHRSIVDLGMLRAVQIRHFGDDIAAGRVGDLEGPAVCAVGPISGQVGFRRQQAGILQKTRR